MGIGQKLMLFAEDAARHKGVKKIFLSLDPRLQLLPTKGKLQGGQRERLTDSARRERYEASGRNSKILVKTLGAQRKPI